MEVLIDSSCIRGPLDQRGKNREDPEPTRQFGASKTQTMHRMFPKCGRRRSPTGTFENTPTSAR